MTVSTTTKLDAVNRIMSVLGESPVNSLSGQLPRDVAMILAIIDEVDLETQARGWHFNLERDVTLTPDVSGRIDLPADVISVRVHKHKYPNLDVTTRDDGTGVKLYDKVAHTFDLNRSLVVDLVYLFDFDACPESYKRFVNVRAGRIAQDRLKGSQAHHQYNERDEATAYRLLRQEEGDQERPNIFNGNAAARVIDRPYPRTRRL